MKTIYCLFNIHHWHYWQTEILRNTARKSKTFFNRECLICKKNESLGWRIGPLGHIPEKSVLR